MERRRGERLGDLALLPLRSKLRWEALPVECRSVSPASDVAPPPPPPYMLAPRRPRVRPLPPLLPGSLCAPSLPLALNGPRGDVSPPPPSCFAASLPLTARTDAAILLFACLPLPLAHSRMPPDAPTE